MSEERNNEDLDVHQALLSNSQINYRSIERRRRSSSTTSSQDTTIESPIIKTIDNIEQNNFIFSYQFWHRAFNQYTTSVLLENKGSVARDHLANERTYLAWLRTSLSLISVGIGLTQLSRLQKVITYPREHLVHSQAIGLFFVISGILFLIFALIRYFHTQVAMMNGYFPASRSTVLIASIVLIIAMLFILVIVTKQ